MSEKYLVLAIVFIAIFLDNLLLTCVVPIIPSLLLQLRDKDFEPKNIKYELKHITNNCPVGYKELLLTYSRHYHEHRVQICKNQRYRNGTLRAASTERVYKVPRLRDEQFKVGILFSIKAIVQLCANPFVGPLTHRTGYSVPMFMGFIIMFLSTMMFAFGDSFAVLMIARACQGIGSSCSSVAGMGMIAKTYEDDAQRGRAMGIALSGLALGVLIGPPFGGFMYEFITPNSPFLVLAALALLNGVFQLCVLKPKIQAETRPPTTLWRLLLDPYVVICAGAITIGNLGMAVLEPALPLWMMRRMGSPSWMQGAAFLPASISYLVGTNIFAFLGHKLGRWVCAMAGMLMTAVCVVCIPMARQFWHLIIPNGILGFAIGMVDSSMLPTMGAIVDARHTAVYGTVYAIADVAFCIPFAAGPVFGGALVTLIGFKWTMVLVAIMVTVYTPFLPLLSKVPKPCAGLYIERGQQITDDTTEKTMLFIPAQERRISYCKQSLSTDSESEF